MKKEKNVFYKSFLGLAALFVLGNAVIVLPSKTENQFTVLGVVTAAILSPIIIFISGYLAQFTQIKEKENRCLTAVKAVVILAVAVYSLFVAADTFYDFTLFVKEFILPELSAVVIVLLFGFTVIFFSLKRAESVLKFSLLSFVFVAILALLFFVALFGKFKFGYFSVYGFPSATEFIYAAKPYFLKVTFPLAILPFYYNFAFYKKGKGVCILGSVIGFLVLFLCILSSLLVFSPELAAKLSYPYASAVSTVTVGKLFTRMDGFSYFLYFACALAKINVCSFVAKGCLKSINNLFKTK